MFYDILPSGAHKERDVPPSPKLRSVGSDDAAAPYGGPLLQRLQDLLGGADLVDPYEQQQQQGRRLVQPQPGSARGGYGGGGDGSAGGASARQRAGGAADSRQQQQQQQQAGAALAPRPYFWRLQQRLQAGAYRPEGSGGGPAGWGALQGGEPGAQPVTEEDYVLLWRRQVYDQVRGRGLGSVGGTPAPPLACLYRDPAALLALPLAPCSAARCAGAAACCSPLCWPLRGAARRRRVPAPPAQDLWAEPLGTDASRISLGSGGARERRLTGKRERRQRAAAFCVFVVPDLVCLGCDRRLVCASSRSRGSGLPSRLGVPAGHPGQPRRPLALQSGLIGNCGR